MFYVTESLLYHRIIPTTKKYEKSSLYVHEKMSNVTQNMDDFWPCVMYVTQDRKKISTIKL